MIHRLVLTILFLLHFTCIAQIDDIQLISWNIKDFGKTKNNEELHRIADIVKESDILAIQEVVAGYGGAQAVARLTDNLNRMGTMSLATLPIAPNMCPNAMLLSGRPIALKSRIEVG